MMKKIKGKKIFGNATIYINLLHYRCQVSWYLDFLLQMNYRCSYFWTSASTFDAAPFALSKSEYNNIHVYTYKQDLSKFRKYQIYSEYV